MLQNNLLLAGIAILLFYALNESQGFYPLDQVQYFLLFVAVALGLSLLEKFQNIKTGDKISEHLGFMDKFDFIKKMDLVDNPIVKEFTGDKNGKQETACFAKPYRVCATQYGDRAILAGYNEHVVPFQQGAVNYDDPGQGIYRECMSDLKGIVADEEDIENLKKSE